MEGAKVTDQRATPVKYRIHQKSTIRLAALVAFGTACFIGCTRKSAPAEAAAADAGTTTSRPPVPNRIDLEKPIVRVETSAGDMTLQLDGVRAPVTVRNFIDYANEGFYDNTLIHYVDAGKTIVAGGYTGNGQPKTGHAPIRNEAHNGLKNSRGTIAMTRDPSLIDSAASQFFINLVDAPQRDYAGDAVGQYGYCVFGQVTEGLDVADTISKSATINRGGDLAQTPEPAVIIKTVRVVR
jgi:cyclophilin family peptidyl-prolyl cis-trans isomerase